MYIYALYISRSCSGAENLLAAPDRAHTAQWRASAHGSLKFWRRMDVALHMQARASKLPGCPERRHKQLSGHCRGPAAKHERWGR